MKNFISVKIGAIAKPDQLYLTEELPKTRSGKIIRRLLKEIAEGRPIGDIMTLADPAALEEFKKVEMQI